MDHRILADGTGRSEVAAIVLIVAAKVVLPVLIVRYPFVAGWANFVLDGIDGDLLIPLGLVKDLYQPVDKITDWITYTAIVLVGYRKAWPAKRLLLWLFLFRSIGQVGFLLTGNELLLALFPNFLEPVFLVTATLLAWNRVARSVPDWQARSFATLDRHRWVIGSLVVAYKLQDEYFTHVANIDRSEFVQRLLGW